MALEAGLPPGVFNVVPGFGKTAGAGLVDHPGVDRLPPRSTAVGQEIMRKAASTLKRVTLELGGKSPNIVFADADMEAAARGAIAGIFYNKGEVCAAGSRILVERKSADELLEKMKGRAQKLTQGDTLDPKTRLGPQVSQTQLDKVLSYIAKGKAEGAELVLGGERNGAAGPGYFLQPTIFANARNDMTIAQEEIFGPVATVIPFENLEQALRDANQTRYGLAAGVWTRDIKKRPIWWRGPSRPERSTVEQLQSLRSRSLFRGIQAERLRPRPLAHAALEGYTDLQKRCGWTSASLSAPETRKSVLKIRWA